MALLGTYKKMYIAIYNNILCDLIYIDFIHNESHVM